MSNPEVDILVLGAGWTSQFLVKLFEEEKVTYALTTTTGKINKTCEGKYDESKIIQFAFQPDPDSKPDDYDEDFVEEQYSRLPRAKTVIVTFKLEGKGQSEKLIRMYNKSHTNCLSNFVQLGSTGIFKEARLHTRKDNIPEPSSRAVAEDEFMANGGSVLALAGLWGDERVPWNWISKVADTKEKLREKQALHLIHGWDVARACLCMHRNFFPGDRSIITDGKVYDWWLLVEWFCVRWPVVPIDRDAVKKYESWLAEIRQEKGFSKKQKQRSLSELGRVLNSDDFWKDHDTKPEIILTHLTRFGRDKALQSERGLLGHDLDRSKEERKENAQDAVFKDWL